MELQRSILLGALLVIAALLWQAWDTQQLHQQARQHQTAQAGQATTSSDNNSVPAVNVGEHEQAQSMTSAKQAMPTSVLVSEPENFIRVDTKSLHLIIDRRGGNVIDARLPLYPVSLEKPDVPFQIFSHQPGQSYIARSGLVSSMGPDTITGGQVVFSSAKQKYTLASGENRIVVPLTWQSSDGIVIKKTFTIPADAYHIDVAYDITNNSQQVWSGHAYHEILRAHPPKPGWMAFHTFTGAAFSTPDSPYNKLSFEKMAQENLSKSVTGGWIAMMEHYFLSAWVPNHQQQSHFYTRQLNDNQFAIGMIGPTLQVKPGQSLTTRTSLYVGPAIPKHLAALAPHLDLTVDYGILWWIASPIMKLMTLIYQFTGNWGWAIILVTLIIKLLFYKLSATSYRSMAKMREMQPKMQAIKERYGDDKEKMTKATMELYKEAKLNPLSGCLPILIQIPVFLSLYWVLLESVEFRQAPFIFWIQDLSSRDPYFVLPILMGISMFLQQKMSPTPPDPMQAKMMMMLPLVFTLFFLHFPSGLVLYWLTNNLISIAQQWYITKSVERDNGKNRRASKQRST